MREVQSPVTLSNDANRTPFQRHPAGRARVDAPEAPPTLAADDSSDAAAATEAQPDPNAPTATTDAPSSPAVGRD